ncbi:MAG TPA: hypothetical protein VLJ59_00725 [Mycobacteriales bacterium]|nr:hypothetical protein [Mycobacteriales bacterium]
MKVMLAVLAVVGTLLGSIVASVFQQRGAERAERFARSERRRQEQLDIYSGFAGTAAQYRRVERDRWHRHREDPAERGTGPREPRATGCGPACGRRSTGSSWSPPTPRYGGWPPRPWP